MAKPSKVGGTSSRASGSGKPQSIRSHLLRRILPVLILPLLALGVISLAGIILIQQRTTDAVDSAEEILLEEVVEDGVTRSSERGARELADYVNDWVGRVDRLNTRATFRESVILSSNAVREAGFTELSPEELETALAGPEARRTQVLALTVIEELAANDENVQVLLVSDDGITLGSTHQNTLDDYRDAEWFTRTQATGMSYRSFVADSEHEPSFELSVFTEPPARTEGGAVLRVRVPLTNVHAILDELAGDDAVDAALVDTSSSVLVADTATNHSTDFLYDPAKLMTPGSGVNTELFTPGVIQADGSVSSAQRVGDRMGDDSDVVFNWLIQTSQPLDVAGSSLTEIRQVAADVDNQRRIFTYGVAALLLTSLAISFVLVRSVASQITAPVKQLSDQAQSVAEDGIPAVVEAARTSAQLPDLDPFEVETNDELAILAHSLNTMQDAAVDLAAGQAKLRRQNVASTFVSLGRRNQNLLNRQLEFIDELERQESDADALENLFRLDHLATRMRRNAENLLVLAGEQTPRRWAKPIAVRDVLRAAAAEIADYRRVRLGDVDPATVSGNLATDLSHLIAELLENAGSFSPPKTPIEVLGQHTSTHYRLAIVDQGIGMDGTALAQLNDRLENPVDFADAPSAYLGLFVVGRLSQELGITVRLASADPTGEGRRRGTIAFIDLPVSLLSTDAPTHIEIIERSAEASARREHNAETSPESEGSMVLQPEATTADTSETVPTPEVVVTAAGFPKRRRGASTATVMEDQLPSTTALVPPVAESTLPPTDLPTEGVGAPDAPPTEITAAGFPKRRNGASTMARTEQAPDDPPEDLGVAPKRDAAEVSNSLRSFRDAVARGRASTPQPAPHVPSPEMEAPSLTPPPLPNIPASTAKLDTTVPMDPPSEHAVDQQHDPSRSQ